MKKLSALLFVVVGLMAILLTGCSDDSIFTEKTYQSDDNIIENIVVQVTDRELEISVSEDNQIHIDYFDSEKEYLDISVSDNNELTVKLSFDKEWTDFIGSKPKSEYRKIKIRIPNHIIMSLSASTANENIRISSLSAENISLHTNGGNIACNLVDIGKAIDLTAKNGNITGSVVGGWDDFSISCRIKKGECNLPTNKDGGKKSFFADCNNGNIEIEFIEAIPLDSGDRDAQSYFSSDNTN